MATIQNVMDKKYLELYKGFGTQDVGPGTDPDMYASQAYARRKVKTLYIGALATIIYSGAEVDFEGPNIIPMHHEPAYNTILALNLNYIPIRLRENVIRYILESNKNRIRSQQQILVDYHALKRAIPAVAGIVRRYKLQLINVREVHPIVEWGEVVRNSGTRYSNVYKRITS